MIRAQKAAMQAIDRQMKQKQEDSTLNLREWWDERIAIMTADGKMTDFQAQQECHKILQRRKAQKELL